MDNKFDKKFKEIEDLFNELLSKFNISQEEIDKLSKKNGYFENYIPHVNSDVNLMKELKVNTLIKHERGIKVKIEQIKLHLSALNKLIKDYKNIK